MYHNTGKDTRILNLFGPAKEDVLPAITARDKWHDEPTLPSRKVDVYGQGGMAYSPYYTDQVREHEATMGWGWYYEKGGKDSFSERQQSAFLSSTQAAHYLSSTDGIDRDVLLGPFNNQKVFNIAPGNFMNLSEAWPKEKSPTNGNPTDANGEQSQAVRQGWLFNIGAKVQCVEWVTQHTGTTQYLSMAALQRPNFPKPREHAKAPAFTPQPPTPASIQIWRFEASEAPGQEGTIDYSKRPHLDLVVCTDWGTVRQFKWCPLPKRQEANEDKVNLGLLAGVWGDGKMRVLDIRYPKSTSTQYIHIKQAAFETRPPDAICTSVTWLSGEHIAAANTDGSIAVWDLTKTLLKPQIPGSGHPRPWYYHCVHSSYILTLAAAYPSHPYLIATSSMDGYLRLTDLRAPAHDSVFSQRSRTGSAALAWHDISQSFLTSDENYTLLALSVRRFHVNMSVGRGNSNITHVATSPVHPFAMLGCTDGMVIATNPMRKVLVAKAEMWHQTWFAHEWRRGTASAADDQHAPPQASLAHPVKRARHAAPLSRVTDGYKPEIYKLWVEQGLPNQYEGVVYNTIHEEETATTQVCWNPNLRFGGWAAAGMGDGLVRVEDLA
ncbi:uncharacterized protein K452DRAFT_259941, partial [Aplosporella prunicola CBS 121167]